MANILQMLSKESIVEMKKKNTREFCDSDFSSFTHFCKYFKNKKKKFKKIQRKKKEKLCYNEKRNNYSG